MNALFTAIPLMVINIRVIKTNVIAENGGAQNIKTQEKGIGYLMAIALSAVNVKKHIRLLAVTFALTVEQI